MIKASLPSPVPHQDPTGRSFDLKGLAIIVAKDSKGGSEIPPDKDGFQQFDADAMAQLDENKGYLSYMNQGDETLRLSSGLMQYPLGKVWMAPVGSTTADKVTRSRAVFQARVDATAAKHPRCNRLGIEHRGRGPASGAGAKAGGKRAGDGGAVTLPVVDELTGLRLLTAVTDDMEDWTEDAMNMFGISRYPTSTAVM